MSDPSRASTEKAEQSSSGAPSAPSTMSGSTNTNSGGPPPPQHASFARLGHERPFVAPSSYLRPSAAPTANLPVPSKLLPQIQKPREQLHLPLQARHTSHSRTMSDKTPSLLDKEQMQGLRGLRDFLKVRNSYDVLPLSFRLIVLDLDLLIKKSLNILIQNSIVSAPLWDSKTGTFAGLLTSTDYINVIQYYCQFPDEIKEVEQFRLSSLRDIEKAIGVSPLETVSVNPTRKLYEACRRMLKTRARRIPLIDVDGETGRETVVSVITQYRILKFIAVNNEQHTMLLKKPVGELGLGTHTNLATATMTSSVLDVISLMVKYNISAVPILDEEDRVLNMFEAVDVIPIINGGTYDELSSSVGEALERRPEDYAGIYTCSEEDRLDAIFDTIRRSRVHRLVVIDDESRLKGIISLSDILKYVLLYGEEEDQDPYV